MQQASHWFDRHRVRQARSCAIDPPFEHRVFTLCRFSLGDIAIIASLQAFEHPEVADDTFAFFEESFKLVKMLTFSAWQGARSVPDFACMMDKPPLDRAIRHCRGRLLRSIAIKVCDAAAQRVQSRKCFSEECHFALDAPWLQTRQVEVHDLVHIAARVWAFRVTDRCCW